MHPCSAPWLHVGGCWVGWGDGWAPCAAEESSSCMATQGQTWYHHSTPPPALPQALTQQSAYHTVLLEPSSFALPLACLPQALHQLGTPPRNTIFAQTSSRVGMHGRRGSQLFLLPCLWWAHFGKGLHQPPCPPASYRLSLLPMGATPQPCHVRSISSKESMLCVCKCMWSLGLQQGAPSRCGPGLPWAAPSHLAGAAQASCRVAQPPPEQCCLCALAGECSRHSDLTPSTLTNVRLVQAMGRTGNQTSLLQLHFQIDKKQTLLPAVTTQFLNVSSSCSRQHPSLDHVMLMLCLPHHQTLGAWPFCLVLSQRTSLDPMDYLCQNTHVHVTHLISSPSMIWTPPPMGLGEPSPSPCKEGTSDAHILNFLCHLVHNQGSLPTAQCTFALSSLCGSLYPV